MNPDDANETAVQQDRPDAADAGRRAFAQLRAALAAVQLSHWSWDPERDVVTAAAAVEALFGVEPGERWGCAHRGVAALHPEDRARHQALVDAALRAGEGWESEFRIVRRGTGEIVWLAERAAPCTDPAGGKRCVLGIVWDITARKRAEGALREGNEKHRALVESVSQATWETDAEFNVVADSPSWRAQTGQTIGERMGDGWVDAVHPEDRAAARQLFRDAVATRRPIDAEFRLRHATSGGWRWTNLRAAPLLDADGSLRGWVCMNIDIDERRCTEAALRAREADLARVQRIGGVGGMDIDIAGGLRSWRSPEYLRLHGLPESAMRETHENWRMRVHPEDRKRAERTLLNALHSDAAVYESEYRIVRPSDGKVRWIHARADIERDARGKALRLVGAHVDTTAQKEAQEALRESEERLRQFGDASQDILWIRDAEALQWQYLTPAFETIYGLSRDAALTGDNYRGWLDLIEPEDRPIVAAVIERVRQGEHVTFEYRIRRPVDGAVRWLRDTDFPIADKDGTITRIGGIGEDITDAKLARERVEQSEGRLRSAIEVGRLGLWDWDVRSGEIHWSDEHFRMEGYAVGEVTPSYEAWAARIHPDDRGPTEAALQHAMETRAEYVREFRTVHPDASIHWLYGRGRFFYDAQGQPVRMIGAMIDITARKEWEERQRVLVAELQHRTRNLMGVVRSISDKTARASSDLADFRKRFGDRIEALTRVQGLLSRLHEHDRVTFDELLRSELAAMNGSAERVTLHGPAGVRLRSSTVQILALALHELATNAVKYGALGQPDGRLTVSWVFEVAGAKGKPWLHIDWRESGVAMPPPGAAPRGTGQGRELIEQALPYQLKAKTGYHLGPDGVRCTISFPVSETNAAGR